MKISAKVYLITAVIIVSIIVLLFFLIQQSIMKSYYELEIKSGKNNVERMTDAIKQKINVLSNTAVDYGIWNNTYEFVLGGNPEYPENDLTVEALERLNFDINAITDASGSIKMVNIIDADSSDILPSLLLERELEAKFLPVFLSQDSQARGFGNVDGLAFIFASSSVTDNSGELDSGGRIIFGAFLDEDDIDDLSSITHLNISIHDYDALSSEMKNNLAENDTIIEAKDANTLLAYHLYKNILDEPSAVLVVTMPRDIHSIGVNVIRYVMLSVILTCVFFGFLFVLLLNTLVLRRISRLGHSLENLEKENMSAVDFKDTGKDELSAFVHTLEKTIKSVQHLTMENKAILQALPDSYIYISKECRIINSQINDSHLSPKTKAPSTLDEIFDVNSAKKIKGAIASVSQKGGLHTVECAEEGYPKKFYEVRVTAAQDDNCVLIIRNISKQKLDEENIKSRNQELTKQKIAALNILEDLTEANKHLKELDQSKSDFLNIASHELKTPLTAISAYLEVLDDYKGQFSEEQLKGIEAIKRNSNQLKTIIGNILEVSRMESGRFELICSEFDAGTKLRALVDNLKVLVIGKPVELRVEAEIGLSINTDELRFEEMVNNLVGNAIKFTNSGYVSVYAKREAEFIKIDVSDTGIGIPADKIKKLFRSFYQVDSSLSRRYGGTGLGLAITKKIVEMQGGSISVRSESTKGSTFTVKLPLKPAEVGKDGKDNIH